MAIWIYRDGAGAAVLVGRIGDSSRWIVYFDPHLSQNYVTEDFVKYSVT